MRLVKLLLVLNLDNFLFFVPCVVVPELRSPRNHEIGPEQQVSILITCYLWKGLGNAVKFPTTVLLLSNTIHAFSVSEDPLQLFLSRRMNYAFE